MNRKTIWISLQEFRIILSIQVLIGTVDIMKYYDAEEKSNDIRIIYKYCVDVRKKVKGRMPKYILPMLKISDALP